MWRISLRDLQYRLRRFLIAIAVTALVFGIAVAIHGIKQTLQREPADLVASFHADRWVVRGAARAHSRRRPYSRVGGASATRHSRGTFGRAPGDRPIDGAHGHTQQRQPSRL